MSTLVKLNSLSFQAFLSLRVQFCSVLSGPVLILPHGITFESDRSFDLMVIIIPVLSAITNRDPSGKSCTYFSSTAEPSHVSKGARPSKHIFHVSLLFYF